MDNISNFHSSLIDYLGNKGTYAFYLFTAFITVKFLCRIKKRISSVPIKNSICVISGASQGIGASVAERLAEKGAKKVILVARTKSKLDAVANIINSKYSGVAVSYPVDCSEYSQVEEMAKTVKENYGTPTILVNCAGAGAWRYLWEMSAEDIVGCMNAPYFAAAFMSKAFTLDMIENNIKGTIVNVQSPAAHISWGGSTAYMAGRWALRGLVEALRADLYPTKIKVQEVILGEVESEYFKNNPNSNERIPKIGKLAPPLSSNKAAKGVINAIELGCNTYSYPHFLGLMMIGNKWIPSIFNLLSIKTGWQKIKTKKQK